jgi:hypothetical protein
MAVSPTTFTTVVNEKSTAKYTADPLTDENGDIIPAANIVSLTLTLCEIPGATIINARDDQDVLNTNNVTVDSAGILIWTMQEADNIIVNSALDTEVHRATFKMTFNTTGKATWDIDVSVRNLSKVS